MFELADLYRLSTPDLIEVAHTVAHLLRERAEASPVFAGTEEAREMRDELLAAGASGIPAGHLHAVLVRIK